ncbi:CesT family type III secretion system chaperone [Thalassomonas sp. RHCl1]|uniref:CesT family type III secretion system chaperone n=1 Tax=Thalassomonas sp. RHCl1 TaxID=2995320 RepID=UPI00248C5FE2|nr:CesT family type III secretion system chaperone [Thalassomonas sp. RHCl1]
MMLTSSLNDLLATLCQRQGWQPVTADERGYFKLQLDNVALTLFTQGDLLLMDSPVLELSKDVQQRWYQQNKVLQLMSVNPDIAQFSTYYCEQQGKLCLYNTLPSELLDIGEFETSLASFVDGIEWINNQLLN